MFEFVPNGLLLEYWFDRFVNTHVAKSKTNILNYGAKITFVLPLLFLPFFVSFIFYFYFSAHVISINLLKEVHVE